MAAEGRKSQSLPRKFNTSSWADKWLFGIFLVVGAAGMWILWEIIGVAQHYVTAWPVGCLLIYALFLGFTKRYQVREDRAGDNLYYLGFLYTLVSLGHALWGFGDSADGAKQIIEDFGIALATTILGLALRVLFNQWREDPIEAERNIRLELNKSVQDLVDEMSRMRMAVTGYTRQVEQSIEEVHFASRKAIEEHIRDTTETYQKTVAAVGSQIEASAASLSQSTGELTNHINTSSRALDGLTQRINEVKLDSDLFEGVLRDAVEPLTASAQEFRGKIQNIRFDPEMIERAIAQPFEQFSEALDHLRDHQAQQNHMISALSQTIDEAAKGAHGIKDALHEVSSLKIPEDAISNAIEPAYQELNEYVSALRTQSQSDQTQLQNLSETVAGFATNISSLEGAFNSVLGVGNAISSMHSGFTEIATSINNTTTEVSSAISKHTELVQGLNIDVEETASRLQEYRAGVDRELELVRQANQQVFSQLAQLAETVVTRLEDKP